MTSVSPTGVTEAIWHFAGYLHLIDELAGSWTLYEDKPPERLDERSPEIAPTPLAAPSIGPSWSMPSPLAGTALAPPIETPLLNLRNAYDFDYPRVELEPVDPILLARTAAAPIVAPPSFVLLMRARVERDDASGETLAQVTQLNRMDDSDVFVWGEDLASGLHPFDPFKAMEDLVDAAEAAVPDAFVAPHGQQAISDAVVARYEAMAAGESDPELADHAIDAPGRYVNGARVADDWEAPETEARERMPEGRNGHEAAGAHAELGANTATNVAVIQDLNELSLQTIVFGDYYRLDAIVQVNAIMNVDTVHAFGGQASLTNLGGAIWDGGGGDTLSNIAAFLHRDVDLGALELPGFGGLHWTVDVLEGDFWDVKSIYQTNLMVDNDIYSKTEYEFFSQVRLGENISINLADFLQMAGNYDMIVIGGNYYAANWIVQVNALLDSDSLMIGHEGGVGQQAISTGENQLTNEALIERYGGGGFEALDGDLAAFVERLLVDGSIDPAEWWELNGVGSTSMRVLYVTGDYYDVNFVQQINLVADADAAAQILAADAAHGEDGAEQWIATGGNELTNVAVIADSEAVVATHVGGAVYEEDFLVQAEIVIEDDGTDDVGLAPELVAFTGGAQAQEDDEDGFAGAPLAGDGDAMGSMMA